jgi:nitroimidazol reductase NimA-like FMN-containing flavoprotein (pyridoxamine 5'-phosphate oxidase superfamily)
MGTTTGPADVEVLVREDCLQLLATAAVGRVAVAVTGEAPLVVPVNFVFVDGRILFRTDYGTVFRRAVLSDRPMSFQVDHIDVRTRTGWSVLVQGRAVEAGEWTATSVPLAPWAAGPKDHWIELAPATVTGRRLLLPDLPGPPAAGYL